MFNARTAALVLLAALLVPVLATSHCNYASPADWDQLSQATKDKFRAAIVKDFNAQPKDGKSWTINSGEQHPFVRPTGRDDGMATICNDVGPYEVHVDAAATNCETNEIISKSTFINANGTLSDTIDTGLQTDITLMNIHAVTWTLTQTTGIKIKLVVVEFGFENTVNTAISNTNITFNTTTAALTERVMVTANIPLNSRCEVVYNQTTCKGTSSVQVPFSLGGWVKVAFSREVQWNGANGDKHKYWYANLNDPTYGLTKDDLTQNMTLSGPTQFITQGKVVVRCNSAVIASSANQTTPTKDPLRKAVTAPPLAKRGSSRIIGRSKSVSS